MKKFIFVKLKALVVNQNPCLMKQLLGKKLRLKMTTVKLCKSREVLEIVTQWTPKQCKLLKKTKNVFNKCFKNFNLLIQTPGNKIC